MREMAPAAARRRGVEELQYPGRATPSTMEQKEELEKEKEETKGVDEMPSFPHYI